MTTFNSNHISAPKWRRTFHLTGIFLSIGFLGLSSFVVYRTKQAQSPQHLPVSAIAKFDGQAIRLEVARTREQAEKGLMYRSSLPKDQGMLFALDTLEKQPKKLQVWMKGVSIPLDLVFLRDNQIVEIQHSVQPCLDKDCQIYESKIPVTQLLEVPSGIANKLKLNVGDRIQIENIR